MRAILALVTIGSLSLLASPSARAAIFHRRPSTGSQRSSGVSLRKRLHVNDLIAEPGTVELDFGGLFSYTTSLFTLPSALKYTPAGNSMFWGRTEYSVSFDSVASGVNAGTRATQFSDRLTFAATSVVYDSDHFDVAVAPQVTTLLRNDSGLRLGATVIARYDGHGSTLAASASWTAATTSSDTNPAGVWDLGVGYGRHLASTGTLSKITPHVNLLEEKTTGFDRTFSVFGGVEYEFSDRVALDLSGQRFSLAGPGPDRQVLLGVTVNFGKVH